MYNYEFGYRWTNCAHELNRFFQILGWGGWWVQNAHPHQDQTLIRLIKCCVSKKSLVDRQKNTNVMMESTNVMLIKGDLPHALL